MTPPAAKVTLPFIGLNNPHAAPAINATETAMTFKIRDICTATPRTRIIRLELEGRRFDYEPGQGVFIGSENIKGSVFSLATPPEESHRSGYLEILGRVGQPDNSLINAGVVQVAGPVGRFTLPSELAKNRRLIFIAGGTGIAPVRSMLRRAINTMGCRIDVLYSARDPEEFPYASELQSLAKRGSIKLWQTVTREGGSKTWTGARGRIGAAVLEPLVVDPTTVFLICGPLALVNSTQHVLQELRVSPERIRTDRW